MWARHLLYWRAAPKTSSLSSQQASSFILLTSSPHAGPSFGPAVERCVKIYHGPETAHWVEYRIR